ncbi:MULTISPECIES: hypothetical protein [Methylococcus]|uniref:Uncharacterized protein n=1 Tax=Methylococcus capsulatus TaxID=414 RepID=A0ABZ2F4Z4_METCP|nr:MULTISPECIES: hypothetical protein [Methylococcus]MDF9393390.1 hypothetical protein [Methylococcus capsulatus]
MKNIPCRVRNLAGDGLCRVDYCPDCTCFHLKLGYASLHLHPEAFLRLCATLNAALARFQRQEKLAGGPAALRH